MPAIRVLLSYYRPYRAVLLLDLLCALIVAGVVLALPLCAGFITREVLSGSAQLAPILRTAALMLLLIFAHAACNYFVDYRGHLMGAHIEADMRRDLFAHLQAQSFGFFDGRRTGELMSRITTDLFWISELCHHGPEDLAIGLLTLAGVLTALFHINPSLALWLLALLPVMAAYAFYFNRRMNRALAQGYERIGTLNAEVEDSLSGIRVVQAYGGQVAERQRFARANIHFVDSRKADYRAEAWFSNGMTVFTQLMLLAAVLGGALAIVRGNLRADGLVTTLLYLGLLVEPINRFVNLARLYQEGMTGFSRFYALMQEQPDIVDAPDAVALVQARGKIEFRGVSFCYKSGSEAASSWVLRDLNLTIQPGEFVALVGPSGVGKTTLASLIPRFYDVSAGQILLDGQDLRQLTLESLRGQVGVVQQDVYLFAGSVLDNIRYGRSDASEAEVQQAARQAAAHEFILALPQGYATDIGQRGVKLSGGQKQRLAIARMFLKDPPILILDEATSALDSASEREVQAALTQLSVGRTTLVIAHRLSTVRRADRIVVLSNGPEGAAVAEQGSHTKLLAHNGLYAALYRAQQDKLEA